MSSYYKCGYCGFIGNSSTPPKIPCISGRRSHAWRSMYNNQITTWKCRKCGITTQDDQTPLALEGGGCIGNDKYHAWARYK